MDNLNVSVFQYRNEPYELEFESILVGITSCYKMMIEDSVSIPSNDENGIRDILLLNYLKNREIRRKVKLINYRFDREIMIRHFKQVVLSLVNEKRKTLYLMFKVL